MQVWYFLSNMTKACEIKKSESRRERDTILRSRATWFHGISWWLCLEFRSPTFCNSTFFLESLNKLFGVRFQLASLHTSWRDWSNQVYIGVKCLLSAKASALCMHIYNFPPPSCNNFISNCIFLLDHTITACVNISFFPILSEVQYSPVFGYLSYFLPTIRQWHT